MWKIAALLTISFLFVGFYLVSFTENYMEIYSQSKISEYMDTIWSQILENQSTTIKLETTTKPSIVTRNYSSLPNENTISENKCSLVTKLIFAKTHKTGSTTLQNIVFRFGEKNKLLFVLPKSGTHIFNLKERFEKSMADLHKKSQTYVYVCKMYIVS